MGTKNKPGAFDCYANAKPDEPMFVLLGRDPTGAPLVLYWWALRLLDAAIEESKAGIRNRCVEQHPDYEMWVEAITCAQAMWRHAKELGKGARALVVLGACCHMAGTPTHEWLALLEGDATYARRHMFERSRVGAPTA